jgi:S1-C subfamily serine protease
MAEALPSAAAWLTITLAAAAVGAADRPIPELYAEVNQAVVEITTVQQVVPQGGSTRQVAAGELGSGFLISGDGRIMTAAHVVQTADEVAVRFLTGDVVKARVVASVPGADLALIQAEAVPDGISPARLGNSDETLIGEQVFVVGAPYGKTHSLTVGHVSARRAPSQLFGGFEQVELLQTDAAINPGNSGGPMFNSRGEVIGVVSHILSTSGGFDGLGFVITSNLAMRVLIDDPTPWSGVDGVLVEGRLARALNLPQQAGILVERVAKGSPAAALGLRPGELSATIAGVSLTLGGDIILAINGVTVGSPGAAQRIKEILQSLTGSDELAVRVLRDGDTMTISRRASSIGYAP